jgi:hypothetical protein
MILFTFGKSLIFGLIADFSPEKPHPSGEPAERLKTGGTPTEGRGFFYITCIMRKLLASARLAGFGRVFARASAINK